MIVNEAPKTPEQAVRCTHLLEALALEGLYSGEPIDVGPSYWEDKHRRLDERLAKAATR